ncbi:hypothetical protein EIN_224380 [Entamoeba invadens IP1]|uniref:GOLD domain-containing protein n=1 Tax=Entamoeba invadens IP1 TaxID=370355 RepID=A0A0A1U5Q7_ENTIV|nr:hypothetical protein EIN_224380 [Entamoeba invadens IP1]ELP88195.1 hypothetical protein EIN_224380 [Entamoeba invadens IP1]|eukprot:XP_004254966.1 hypothetical protein EIN_224380 [Entamoeba invadens IP1]
MLVILLLFSAVQSFMMEVPTNGYRCIFEEGFDKEKITGTYRFPPNAIPSNRNVVFKIFRGEKNERVEVFASDFDPKGISKNFGSLFTSDNDKLHVCVIDSSDTRGAPPVLVEINFADGKKDDTNVIKKQTINKVDAMSDEASSQASTIYDYVKKCVALYDSRRGLNEATNTMSLWMMIFVIGTVIASSLYQVISLKRFFRHRKII